MSLPPLHPISHSQTYVRGEVVVDPTAAIAPGVLLQAEAGSRIVIAAGVCIGMGTILHVYQGTLEIEEGVTLGTGVLVVGQGKVGTNACIGSSTTIFNCSIEQEQVVPPGSLIGDTGRSISLNKGSEADPAATSEPGFSSSAAGSPSERTATETSASTTNQPGSESAQEVNTQVYGKAYINQLLGTLLPHRQALNRPLQNAQSPASDP